MNPEAQAAPAPGGRARWPRVAVGILVLGTVLALVLHAPSAMSAFISAFSHFRVGRVPWLGLAAVLEAASLASAAMVQRQLLASTSAYVDRQPRNWNSVMPSTPPRAR